MAVEISQFTLSRLGDEISEIRQRALDTIDAKFRRAAPNLENLDVNPFVLTKYLLGWLNRKPASDEERVLRLLIAILNSKYKLQIISVLSSQTYKDILKQINCILVDEKHRTLFKEILRIVNDYLEREACFINTTRCSDNMSEVETSSRQDLSDFEPTDNELDLSKSLKYTDEWDVPGASDLNSLRLMKTSLSGDTSGEDLDQALRFFGVIVNDFPAEYFLQPPYVFLSLINLIDAKETCNKGEFLNAVLSLTKNLSKRLTVRRLSKTYTFVDPQKKGIHRKQVTIGTYCMQSFFSVLNFLQEIYNTSRLHEINLCFLVLIEIVDLICLGASSVPLNATDEYNTNALLKDLGFFLKYTREAAILQELNKYKTNQNNSIILIYLICRLVMYKDNIADKTGSDAGVINFKKKMRTKLTAERLRPSDDHIFENASDVSEDLSTWRSKHGTNEMVWKKELEIALLNYPLKHFYSEVHDLVVMTLNVDLYTDTSPVTILFSSDETLQSAISLLRHPEKLKGEELIIEGLKACETLSIIQSGDLVLRLFTEISNSASKFDGNDSLRVRSEELLLRLFSHENVDLKRITYRQSSEKMTYFFSCIMDGTTFVSKSYAATVSKSNFLGLPLTVDILIEIICFGLTNSDTTISSNAEKIVTLILRSKNIIPHYWDRVCEILVPAMGLLQCFVKWKYSFGDLIMQLCDPDDEVKLPKLHLIEGNIRLLFSREMRTREEALCRLTYILQADSRASRYIPNIDCLSDLLPNNICVVDHIFDPSRNQFGELYEKSYITPMIKLLNSPEVDPSIRRTTLVQLNVMLQDPAIADHFYQANGMDNVLNILRHSLLISTSQNYADNVVPVVGILAKLCIQKPGARRALSNDVDTYILLLRSLIINYHNEVFKNDCAIVLFLTTFSEFVVGSSNVSLPVICQRLLVPFKCEYHWKTSSFDVRSPLELLLLKDELIGDNTDSDLGSLTGIQDVHIKERTARRKIFWEYVRMSFANLWFGSLEEALLVKLSQEDGLNSGKSLKYIVSNNNKSMAFNDQLCLTNKDLKTIEMSWTMKGIGYWTKYLQNATTHEQVNLACAAIENYSNIDSKNYSSWDFPLLLSAVDRYADIAPKGDHDIRLFRDIIHMLTTLVERGFQGVIDWLWKNLNKKNSVFLDILAKDKNWPVQLYADNAKLIEVGLLRFLQCGYEILDSKATKEDFRQFFEKMFEMVNSVLDETFKKRDLDNLRAQLSLLRVITSSMQIQCDDYTASFLANKLLRFITAIKSLAQAGSTLNKNCLLTIGNIMLLIDELKLDKKNINLLSGLCGHTDFEIRAYSWCILTKVANTLRGAELLIKELSYLPGGFHACCLSTLLDDHEPSIVRENAAQTFATLISYCNDRNDLVENVYPRHSEQDKDRTSLSDEMTIFRIIKQHDFYKKIVVALKNFCATETIDFNENSENVPITSCDLVRSFCVVLANIAGLNSRLDTDFLIEIAMEIMRLVPFISSSVNKSSVLLLTEICTFLSHYLAKNRELLERVTAQEVYLIRSLVTLLDINLYELIPRNVKAMCWSQTLTLLSLLARTPYGFQAICNALEGKQFGHAFYFILNGITYSQTLVVPVLKFSTTLLIVSQLEKYDFETFANYLDNFYVDESIKKYVNEPSSDDTTEIENFELLNSLKHEKKYASEILYDYWSDIFQSCKKNSQVTEGIFKAMESLLKCSHLARASATNDNFLLKLVEHLEEIYSDIGMTCTEFIRRHGNTKLEKVLHKIKLYYNIILSWYSVDCLKDTTSISPLLKIFIRLWPWVITNFDMSLKFMKLLCFLCEDSLPVCKSMTSVVIGNSSSMLQLVAEYCSNESSKVKNGQFNVEILALGLRVVSNCCACFEGRNQINKINMIQTLSRLQPYVTKQQKQWNKIILLWLQFYEVFTRYPDINSGVKYLHLLRTLVENGQQTLGICALEILRNMAFNESNRTALLASEDFLYTMQLGLESKSIQVQLLVVTSIWKLISLNNKGRHVIKNSILFHKLTKLNQKLKRSSSTGCTANWNNEEDEENLQDLITASEYAMKILST